jgi:hypothetical protein
MRHTIVPTVLKRLLILVVLCSLTIQAADKAGESKIAPIEADVRAAWERRVPDYTIDNLPLGEVVKQLQDQYREINFHMKAQQGPDAIDLSGTSVRVHRLRNVTLAEFLQVLEQATERPIQIVGKPGDRLVVFDSKAGPVEAVQPIETRVLSLAEYIGQRDGNALRERLSEFYSVLEHACMTFESANKGKRHVKPTINFHEGTKLLIVVGRPDELALVQEIVSALQETVRANKANPVVSGAAPAPAKR